MIAALLTTIDTLGFAASSAGNWHNAKAAAHDELIALINDNLVWGPRRVPKSAVFVERAVHQLPRECGLPWMAEGVGLLSPDLVALDSKNGELLIIEVTICPDVALGKYVNRKRSKYLPLCKTLAFERTPNLVVPPPLVVAVGTGGGIPLSTQDAMARILAASHEERFGDVGAAPDSLLVQRDLILDEAVRIAKSRPDAPAARGAARERRQQARRGPKTTRRQREKQDS